MSIVEVMLATFAIVLMAIFSIGSCILVADRSRRPRWVQKEFDFTKKSV